MENTLTVAPITHVVLSYDSDSHNLDVVVEEGEFVNQSFLTQAEAIEWVESCLSSSALVETTEYQTVFRRQFLSGGYRYSFLSEAQQQH